MPSEAGTAGDATGKHILFYDGTCGFCSKSVQRVLNHDSNDEFRFATLTGELAREVLGSMNLPDSIVVLTNFNTAGQKLLIKSDAIKFIVERLPAYNWLAVFMRCVPAPVRDAFYDFIARNRYHIAGQNDTCLIPTAESSSKFIGS